MYGSYLIMPDTPNPFIELIKCGHEAAKAAKRPAATLQMQLTWTTKERHPITERYIKKM